ncbi:MAG TPA: hypothetical protein VNI57_07845 [Candidatus Saccharimonadales bacterium]|nr:hypothetical protein [Candidatus Saccharimonadales bacterium]
MAGLTTGRALPGAMTLESSLFGEQAFAATGAASRESIAAAGCPGTIVFYDGGGTGAWEDPNNWTLGRLPNSADDVCIPAIYAVTLSSGTQSIHSLYVANGSSLTVSGANFSITTASQIDGTFTLHSGIVSGSGDITTEHIFTWDGGSLIGAANFFANAGMSLAGSASRILSSSRVLTVTGTTTWTGPGSIQVGSGAGIVNNGTWDCQSDASVTGGGSSVGFTNTSGAIFKKTGDAGTTSVSIPFNNDGTVTVQTGTLSLSGGGTSSGAFQASPGTTLQFSGGVHSLTSTSSIAADSVVFSAGTSTVDGDYAATSGTTVSGATATFNPSATVTSIGSALVVSSGTASFSSGETLTPTTLTVSGGTLRGTDTITVSGLTTWTSGTMRDAGTTNANGGVSITGGSTKSLTSSRVLTTSGTTTWTGTGSIQVGSGAGIVSNGTWDCQSDASLTGLSSPGPFTNSSMAVFEKSAGAGTTTVGIAFDNDGTVTVQTGTLSLSGGGTSSGAFQAAPGTTLQFSGGVHSLTSTSSIAADSVVFSAGTSTVDGAYAATSGTTVSGATATFDPAATVTSIGSALLVSAGTASFSSGETLTPTTLTLSGGTLRGTDTITVSGLTTWSFGTMRDAGTTNANGGVSIAGGSTKSLTSSRILTTSGTTTWTGTGSIQVSSGSTITNNGTWDCQSDASMTISSSPGPFTNGSTATFRKSAGAGASGIAISFQNAGSVQALAGLLQFTGGYVQTAGSTTLDGGSISSSTTMDIQGGELTGAGTITANVTSAGHAAPGLPLGQLTISGNYTQSMAGSLDVSLGGTNGGTDYDQLLLTGTGVASLGGTLNVDLVNGFTSTGGDSFTLMTFTSATGAFQSTSLPPGCWQLLYNPTSVVLEYPGAPEVLDMAFAADAETLSWTPLAGPVVYDVMRGSLSMLPVGDEPDETCLASQTSATSTSDATLPAPGAGFYYLARATDSCGVGSYGTTSGGSGRTSTVCP